MFIHLPGSICTFPLSGRPGSTTFSCTSQTFSISPYFSSPCSMTCSYTCQLKSVLFLTLEGHSSRVNVVLSFSRRPMENNIFIHLRLEIVLLLTQEAPGASHEFVFFFTLKAFGAWHVHAPLRQNSYFSYLARPWNMTFSYTPGLEFSFLIQEALGA